jgi:phage baseplate assembly protein W
MSIYRGFTTKQSPKSFKSVDIELVKQDIANHFNTRRGERVMNPNFGTIIWNLLFDQFTEEVRQAIQDDVVRIVNSDPRVALQSATVTDYRHGIQIALDILIKETNQVESMRVQFDQSAAA